MSGRGRAKTRQPSHAVERLRECGEAPEAGGAAHRLNPLADGLQGVGDLMTNLSMMLMVGMEVKAHETTISHVEADLEKTHHRPLPGAPNEGPKGIERRGCTREIKRATKHDDRELDMPEITPHDRERQ
jgi:hypothetical protein